MEKGAFSEGATLRGRLRRAREHGVEGGVVAALRHPSWQRLAPAAALRHLFLAVSSSSARLQ